MPFGIRVLFVEKFYEKIAVVKTCELVVSRHMRQLPVLFLQHCRKFIELSKVVFDESRPSQISLGNQLFLCDNPQKFVFLVSDYDPLKMFVLTKLDRLQYSRISDKCLDRM